MIWLFHGDHEVKISQEVTSRISEARSQGWEVVRLSAKKMEMKDLETALGTDALFAARKLVVIEGLFSLPKSKKKDALIQWVKEHDSAEMDIILAEKKVLTPAQARSASFATIKPFKYPAVMFTWLESLGMVPAERSRQLLHEVLEREEAPYAMIMLVRQVRQLTAFAADGVYEGPPFLRSKVASQARAFSLPRLLKLHSQLLELDELQKSSRLSLSLSANLDLILAEL